MSWQTTCLFQDHYINFICNGTMEELYLHRKSCSASRREFTATGSREINNMNCLKMRPHRATVKRPIYRAENLHRFKHLLSTFCFPAKYISQTNTFHPSLWNSTITINILKYSRDARTDIWWKKGLNSLIFTGI